MTWLLIATGAIAAVALGFADYLGRFVATDLVGGRMGVAAITIVVFTATNYIGVKPGTVAANLFTVAKIAALAALILVGLFAPWGVAPTTVATAPVAPPLASGFAAAFVAVLFTIGGWQQTNMVAGEIKDPARTLPKALAVGIAIVIAIYLGANIVYLKALGRDGLAGSTAAKMRSSRCGRSTAAGGT